MFGRTTELVIALTAALGVVVGLVGSVFVGTKSIWLAATIVAFSIHVIMVNVILKVVRDIRPEIRGAKRALAIAVYLLFFGGIMAGVAHFQVTAMLKVLGS